MGVGLELGRGVAALSVQLASARSWTEGLGAPR